MGIPGGHRTPEHEIPPQGKGADRVERSGVCCPAIPPRKRRSPRRGPHPLDHAIALGARGTLLADRLPFIEGSTGVEAGLSEQHWRALGGLVKRLHASALPPDLMEVLPAETYRVSAVDVVRRVDRAVSGSSFPDRSARQVAAFWTSHRHEIQTLVERTKELGPQVEELSLRLVLCHADLHTRNRRTRTGARLNPAFWSERPEPVR
jgi:hypothetical protein